MRPQPKSPDMLKATLLVTMFATGREQLQSTDVVNSCSPLLLIKNVVTQRGYFNRTVLSDNQTLTKKK